MDVDRRQLLQLGSMVALGGLAPLAGCSKSASRQAGASAAHPDHTIRIADTNVELAPVQRLR